MKNTFFVCILIALIPSIGLGQSIRGKVMDENKEAIEGAHILIVGSYQQSHSDHKGYFELKGLKVGSYKLMVSHLGYATYEQNIALPDQSELEITLKSSPYMLNEAAIQATRAGDKTPVARTDLDKTAINQRNLGQDVPILLNFTPSVVTTSDAGTGIGYTGIRVRGSDATRINVTINGIPYNDAESQGTFWVDIPDIASSANSIQIQRGAGTSTNGAGAFGGSVNLNTFDVNRNSYAGLDLAYGSFNTKKLSTSFGTGLINRRFSFDGRLSLITSDGYVDRADSDLKSFYLAGGYYGDRSTLRLIAFGGEEHTYQSWNGIDRATMENDRTQNSAGAIYNDDGSISYYDDETDNYNQNHYQLHYSYAFTPRLRLHTALHYTEGKGYYEQYRQNEDFADYYFDPLINGTDTINTTDLIRRRWLDNDFYGFTFSLNYQKSKWDIIFGGAWNRYEGLHYGEVIWAEYASNSEIRDRYYQDKGIKTDFNTYVKANYQLTQRWNLFADLQLRTVQYEAKNDFRGNSDTQADDDLAFFNPKAGLTYQLNPNNKFYLSYSIAHREPNRTDYLDAPNGITPKAEQLHDVELGYQKRAQRWQFNANYYMMWYRDQLVLTGEINDVGAFIRANTGESYRTGLELEGAWAITKKLQWQPNITYSINKNRAYKIVENDVIKNLGDTKISYSPEWVAGSALSYQYKDIILSLLSKYVGDQYLSNTEAPEALLEDYFTNDFLISYQPQLKGIKEMELKLLINNLFDTKYASNGYMWGTTAYLFPQAGRHLLAGLRVRF